MNRSGSGAVGGRVWGPFRLGLRVVSPGACTWG